MEHGARKSHRGYVEGRWARLDRHRVVTPGLENPESGFSRKHACTSPAELALRFLLASRVPRRSEFRLRSGSSSKQRLASWGLMLPRAARFVGSGLVDLVGRE